MPDEKKPTTAMTRTGDNPALQIAALAKYQADRFNVLAPLSVAASGLESSYREPPGFKLAVNVVSLNPEDTQPGGSLYKTGGSSNRKALTGRILDQIAGAAGLEVYTERVDARNHPHYSEHRATVKGRDWTDGQVRSYTATKTVDLRDDCGDGTPGPDCAGMEKGGKQIQQARKFIHEMCASKAVNRAIRHLLGINTAGYTDDELRKPFVVPKLQLDASVPEVAEAMLAQATGGAEALWGRSRAEDAREAQGGFNREWSNIIEARALPAPMDDDEPIGGEAEPPPADDGSTLRLGDGSLYDVKEGVVHTYDHTVTPKERFSALRNTHAVALFGLPDDHGKIPGFDALCRKAVPAGTKAGALTHEQINDLGAELGALIAKGGA